MNVFIISPILSFIFIIIFTYIYWKSGYRSNDLLIILGVVSASASILTIILSYINLDTFKNI